MFPSSVGLLSSPIVNHTERQWPARRLTSHWHRMRATRWIGIQNGRDDPDALPLTPPFAHSADKESRIWSSVAVNTRIRLLHVLDNSKAPRCCGSRRLTRD